MARRRDLSEFIELYRALKRRMESVTARAYSTIGMGSTQARFLKHVGEHSGISQAELARVTGTDPALTGRVLHSLIRHDFVRRERSEEDRREYVLELGPAGRRAQDRIEQLRARLYERILGALDQRDVQDFERIVTKILTALADFSFAESASLSDGSRKPTRRRGMPRG